MAAVVHDRQLAVLPAKGEFVPVEVDDPWPTRPGEKVIVTRRLDVLSRMYARNQIDEAEFQAGVKWQRLYETGEIGSVGSIDFTKEVVDGGRRIRDPLTDKQQRALREVARVDRKLGEVGSALIRKVLLHGQTIGTVAERWDFGSEKFIGIQFRKCLAVVAKELGHLEL
jgi:hypothetical protein